MEPNRLSPLGPTKSHPNLAKTKSRKGILRTQTEATRDVSLEEENHQNKYIKHSQRDTLKLDKKHLKQLKEREKSNPPRDTLKLTPELIKQIHQEDALKVEIFPDPLEALIKNHPEEAVLQPVAEQVIQEKKQESIPLAASGLPQSSAHTKKQSRFRKFIIQNFNNPNVNTRKAYKKGIKEELKDFENLSPDRQRQLKAFQEYYEIKPKKTKTTRIQEANRKFKNIVDYFEQLSAFARNTATIAQRLTPSSINAAIQTSAQTGATIGSAGIEAAGIGLGVFLMPIQTLDAIRSVKKAIQTKEKHDYANIYIKNRASSSTQQVSNQQKELLAAAHYLKNQHKYWDKRLNALDATQSLVATGLSTTCAFVAAVAAPLLPIITPIAGGVGLGIITGSFGTSIGVITFKNAKSAFRWVQAKKAKQAYENPEGLAARSARRKAYKAYKLELDKLGNNLGKKYKLKNLSPAARILLKQEINLRAQEITKQNYMQRSGKFASEEICKMLRKEQMKYFNDKSTQATLEETPTLDFLRHFNIPEDIIKATIDCEDYTIAAKLLRQTMKEGISNIKRTAIQEALEEARSKRQEAKQNAKTASKAAKEAAKIAKA